MSLDLGIPTTVSAKSSRPDVGPGLVDRFGRVASDMRLSVIDKCNLRCTYCMPAEGMPWLPKSMLMTIDENTRLVAIGVDLLGVRELRLTGGEPLVRHDLEEIVASIHERCPELSLSLTTNAVGLASRAAKLKAAGLERINVSLDSLHPGIFAQLTRRPMLDQVLAGIDAAKEAGFRPVKINAVLQRDINDHEASDLLAWALAGGNELRFIEHMPLDGDHRWNRTRVVDAAEIRAALETRFRLDPDPAERGGAPAERFEVRPPGAGLDTPALGRVGLISSVTEPFCAACTRTRVTAEGRVMSCLFSHEEFDLLEPLRAGADDEAIAQRWREAMWAKPRAHGSDTVGLTSPEYVQPERSMSAIGG